MAVVDGLGGFDMLLLATATVSAVLYSWAARRLLHSGLHWLPTVLLIMVTIAASANHIHVRPHMSTIGFLGLTFGWLCDFGARRIFLVASTGLSRSSGSGPICTAAYWAAWS